MKTSALMVFVHTSYKYIHILLYHGKEEIHSEIHLINTVNHLLTQVVQSD